MRKSSTTKLDEHIPCGYSMSTIWPFGDIDNNHDIYRSEDCMERFYEKHRKNTISLEIIVIIQVNIEVLHIAYII